jgi:nitrite reductase/ring-hydroxylating ferredoxin subunit
MEPILRDVVDQIGEIKALDRVGKTVGETFDRFVKPGALKDFLSGTWLGHPLHPVLTDLPIAAWSSSYFLDVFGGRGSRKASDRLLAVGILTAVPTAISGLTDWSDTGGRARRVGMAHAMGNVAAIGLFTLSLRARRRGRRFRGFLLSSLGIGAQSASAYLGGHLSFGKGIGVDHTAFERRPRRWTAVLAVDALTEGKPVKAEADGAGVLIYKEGDSLFAIADTCTHRGCSLSEGDVQGGVVECPCHGSAFRITDGRIVRGPATAPQPAYDARITDGKVEVKARS